MDIVGSLGYIGQSINFIDVESFAYVTGNALCMYNFVKGPRELIWKCENGLSCFATNSETKSIVYCPSVGRVDLELVVSKDSVKRTTLNNPLPVPMVNVCFNRDGDKLYGITSSSNHHLVLWDCKNNYQMLFTKKLDGNYKICTVNPCSSDYVCCYGDGGLMVGFVRDVLGGHSVKVSKINFDDEEALAMDGTSDANELPDKSVKFALWFPGNRLLVGTPSGAIFQVNCGTNQSPKLLGRFSTPERRGRVNLKPIHAVFTMNNVIVSTKGGLVYWFPLSFTSTQEDFKIDFDKPLQMASIKASISCLVVDQTYQTLLLGTFSGDIMKLPLYVEAEFTAPEADLDPTGEEEFEENRIEQVLPEKIGNDARNGVALCTQHVIIDILKFSGSGRSSLSMFVTSSHSGCLQFWRHNAQISEPLSVGGGIRRSIPRPVNCLFDLYMSRAASTPDKPLKPPAICMIEFVTLALKHAKLMFLGTDDGSIQVWTLDAQENEDEDVKEALEDHEDGEYVKMIEDDEGNCLVRLEMRKIFQLKLFDSAVKLLTFMPMHVKDLFNSAFHLKAAIASETDNRIYILKVLQDNSVVVNSSIESYLSVGDNTIPVSLVWNADSLYAFCDNGSVVIYNVAENGVLTKRAEIVTGIQDLVASSLIAMEASGTLIMVQSSNIIHTLALHDLLNDASILSSQSFRSLHHDDVVVCAIQSPAKKYFATGCIDGSIHIWKHDEENHSLILANKVKLHHGPVACLIFSSDSSFLLTCGIDGSCFIVSIDKPLATDRALIRGLIAKGEEPKYITELVPEPHLLKLEEESATWVKLKKIDEERDLKSKYKFKAMGVSGAISEISSRLNALVETNLQRNELEILDRSEFVIDVKHREEIVTNNTESVVSLRNSYKNTILCNELVAARTRLRCWDNLEVKSNNLFSFLGKTKVSSMSIQNTTPEQAIILQKVKRLRAMEIRTQKLDEFGSVQRLIDTPYYRCAWTSSMSGSPPTLSWVLNDGTRWPISDKVALLLINEKAEKNPPKEVKDTNAAANAKETKAHSFLDDDDDYSFTSEEEVHEMDESDILNLLYPPQAVRTRNQRRVQIILLREVVRLIRAKFNEQFDRLHNEKEDIINSIDSRNNRIRTILEDLHQNDSLFSPTMSDREIAGSSVRVKQEELVNRPYESEAARMTRLREEEEKRQLELQRDKEDIKGRALEEMMNGTLVVKRDVLSTSKLAKPEWMSTLKPNEMSDSQVREYEVYQTKLRALQEEQATYRKTLEIEMRKLRNEIAELCRSFDERLNDLSSLKLLVNRELLSQELFVSRLSLNMAKTEQALKVIEKSEDQIKSLRDQRSDSKVHVDKLNGELDILKSKYSSIQDEERLMDKTFRRDIQNLCNNTFDQNSLKILTELYRQRSYPVEAHGQGREGTGVERSDADASNSKQNSKSTVNQRSTKKSVNTSSRQNKKTSSLEVSKMKKQKSSKAGSISNKDAALGPMQLAALALKTAEVESTDKKDKDKDPYFEAIVQQERQRVLQDATIPILSALNLETDCPEGFDIDQVSWSKLQDLRSARIEKEIEGKLLAMKIAKLKQKLEHFDNEDAILASCINDIKAGIDLAGLTLKNISANMEVVIRIRQGQDQVDRDAAVTDYSQSLLIPVIAVGKFNSRIKELGREKIHILYKIKLFRRKINLIGWQARHHDMEARHYEAYLTDVQLFRVNRELQKIIREGRVANLAKVRIYTILISRYTCYSSTMLQERIERFLQRKEFINHEGETRITSLKKTHETLQRQLDERSTECAALEGKIFGLRSQVLLSKSVKSSRDEARGQSGDLVCVAAAKMKKVVSKRHMIDTARAQAEEIDYLRQELDKMRQKTFPSFVK